MINIIYEDNHLLVVEKPVDIPVQPDSSGDLDLFNMLKIYLKEKYNKPGEAYLGLVHRLDRPVGGVMVFAKTSKAAKRLTKQIQNGEFKKTYVAVIEGHIKESGTFIDKLLKDEKTNVTYSSEKGKYAELSYNVVDYVSTYSLVRINLKTGRHHQIRYQFASRKMALYGDQRYNPNTAKDHIALFALKLSFKHPITKEEITFELPLPERFPFTLFKS